MTTVFVYRNREDDSRTREDLHFCWSCVGWYGVPHTHSHCQQHRPGDHRQTQCACRFCCEVSGRPIQGTYGFITDSDNWKPPPETVTIGGLEFIRHNDEWMLWCGCGDVIPLDQVIHDHCANCHAATCHDCDQDRCCTVCNRHTTPHKGCILR